MTVMWSYDLRDSERSRPSRSPPDLTIERVMGDEAHGKLEYSGGCKPHAFRIVAGGFRESHPVQVRLIVLDESADTCTDRIRENVVVDLKPLKHAYQMAYGTSTGEIRLLIPGADLYRF